MMMQRKIHLTNHAYMRICERKDFQGSLEDVLEQLNEVKVYCWEPNFKKEDPAEQIGSPVIGGNFIVERRDDKKYIAKTYIPGYKFGKVELSVIFLPPLSYDENRFTNTKSYAVSSK